MWGFLCCLVFLYTSSLLSQTLLQEDFSYSEGDSLVSHGWSAHGSAGTNPVRVITPGLVYIGYAGSGTGNAARLYTTGEDVNHSIPVQSDADVYVSILVLVQETTTSSAEHFLHFNVGTHVGRVFARKASGKIAFGIAKSSESAIFTEAVYSLSTVYLVVLRYTHVSGNDNDTVRLFVMESGVPSAEPANATLGPVTAVGSEPSGITSVALRQGGSVVTDFVVDGIRVGTSWDEAGLPVTFSRFAANPMGNDVRLEWRTESETGNFGFEIERREMGQILTDTRRYESENDGVNSANSSPFTLHPSPSWIVVGFVPGSGTSSSPKDYSFVDQNVLPGRYAYRIKQIDHSGFFTYTSTLEIGVGSFPRGLILSQNYPNPFNPSTTVRFSSQKEERTSVRVYDLTGRLVRVLLDRIVQAGWHEIDFDAEGLPSGIYLARIEAGGQIAVRKIVLAK
ncbi:MAG: T9SS type A sorting domain-containing protein [Bacteroidota bacterium]